MYRVRIALAAFFLGYSACAAPVVWRALNYPPSDQKPADYLGPLAIGLLISFAGWFAAWTFIAPAPPLRSVGGDLPKMRLPPRCPQCGHNLRDGSSVTRSSPDVYEDA